MFIMIFYAFMSVFLTLCFYGSFSLLMRILYGAGLNAKILGFGISY